MKHKLLSDTGQKTYAIILEDGDEVMESLDSFARKHRLKASRFSAIGAFRQAVLGFFEIDKKEYKRINVPFQTELLMLAGDITIFEGKPKLHAHAVLGKDDGTTLGGHLLEAIVRPTLEVMLTESPAFLERKMDEQFGIPLIKI